MHALHMLYWVSLPVRSRTDGIESAMDRILTRPATRDGDLVDRGSGLPRKLASRGAFATTGLWDSTEKPSSHWILVMSSVDQQEELAAASELLRWREFTAKEASRVACVPSSKRSLFRQLASSFEITSFPTLVLSNSRDMSPALVLRPKLLRSLLQRSGNLRRLLTELHTQIELGADLASIAKRLDREEVIQRLAKFYAEAKSIVSVSV